MGIYSSWIATVVKYELYMYLIGFWLNYGLPCLQLFDLRCGIVLFTHIILYHYNFFCRTPYNKTVLNCKGQNILHTKQSTNVTWSLSRTAVSVQYDEKTRTAQRLCIYVKT